MTLRPLPRRDSSDLRSLAYLFAQPMLVDGKRFLLSLLLPSNRSRSLRGTDDAPFCQKDR